MLEKINISDIKDIALKAGEEILKIYENDFHIEYKDDKSPLTEADLRSNEIICTKLLELYPDIPILSEENKEVDYETRKDWEYYWCIDPIDGTKEFIKKNGEFTVNIALIHKNSPVLGVVYAPVLNDIYYAKEGEGAYKNDEKLPLFKNSNLNEKLCIVASKSHLSSQTQEFIDNLDTKEIAQISKGSSIKLCLVAEGLADIYPRLAPTMEWDTAAADAIVRQSGKMVYIFDEVFKFEADYRATGNSLIYNKENLLNPDFVVA